MGWYHGWIQVLSSLVDEGHFVLTEQIESANGRNGERANGTMNRQEAKGAKIEHTNALTYRHRGRR
jgi:hypothetical protein